jgi:hypothetical protein
MSDVAAALKDPIKLADITAIPSGEAGLNNKRNEFRRRIEKIFTQINKIGSKGRDNELEYKKYVDDIVARVITTTYYNVYITIMILIHKILKQSKM